MTVGIIGLGLIGGSIAKSIKQRTDCRVLGFDISPTVVNKAKLVDAIDDVVADGDLYNCDIIFIALYPNETLKFVKESLGYIKSGTVIMDVCGVKREICTQLEALAKQAGAVFIGGHPMAGREFSGFAYSTENLFADASMVVTPYKGTPIQLVEMVKKLFLAIGFGQVVITTPEEHDKMIAYTSQLAHVVSNAYVKSPTARSHAGFSAGSYKDLTRVARLNEDLWTELFLHNRDYLVAELDILQENLSKYRHAIKQGDQEEIRALLRDGREIKEAIDACEQADEDL